MIYYWIYVLRLFRTMGCPWYMLPWEAMRLAFSPSYAREWVIGMDWVDKDALNVVKEMQD